MGAKRQGVVAGQSCGLRLRGEQGVGGEEGCTVGPSSRVRWQVGAAPNPAATYASPVQSSL